MEGGWEDCVYHMGWKLSMYLMLHVFIESVGSTMFVLVEFLTPCGMDYVHFMMTL